MKIETEIPDELFMKDAITLGELDEEGLDSFWKVSIRLGMAVRRHCRTWDDFTKRAVMLERNEVEFVRKKKPKK